MTEALTSQAATGSTIVHGCLSRLATRQVARIGIATVCFSAVRALLWRSCPDLLWTRHCIVARWGTVVSRFYLLLPYRLQWFILTIPVARHASSFVHSCDFHLSVVLVVVVTGLLGIAVMRGTA
jgi:hypothetical protein